jgi:hypothetical protein
MKESYGFEISDWRELIGLRSSPVRGERHGHARVQTQMYAIVKTWADAHPR